MVLTTGEDLVSRVQAAVNAAVTSTVRMGLYAFRIGISGNCPPSTGLLGAFSLLLMNYLVVRFLFRHRRIDQILEGSPTVLVENGKVRRKELAKELLTESELTTVCHRQRCAEW